MTLCTIYFKYASSIASYMWTVYFRYFSMCVQNTLSILLYKKYMLAICLSVLYILGIFMCVQCILNSFSMCVY